MTINTDDVIEASARMEYDASEDIINVYQFKLAAGGPMEDPAGVSDILAILEGLYNLIITVIPAIQAFRDVTLRNITQNTLLGVHPWPTLTVGGNATDPLPPGVAGVVNLTSVVPRVTPRKYLGACGEGTTEIDGTFSAGTTALFALFAADLLTPFAESNGTWLYGYLSPKVLNFVLPNSASVADIPGYQRRRKQGRGS